MNRAEHLGVIAMEECNEVAQRISKALRFGMQEVQPEQLLTNRERVYQEFTDLVAVMSMLGFEVNGINPLMFAAKVQKVEKYLAYSKEQGTLDG